MIVLQAFTSEAVPQQVRERAIEQSKMLHDTLRQLIAEGQAAGQVVAGNADYLASVFAACLQGLAVERTFYNALSHDLPDLDTILHILKP
jgi:cytidylate kinase